MKEGEKLNENLDLVRELKMLQNTVMSILIRAFGTVLQEPGKEARGNWRLEEESRLSRPQQYLNQLGCIKVSYISDDICCHLDSSEKSVSNINNFNITKFIILVIFMHKTK